MELKDLAPWIAIAITLSLSILVPVFTQIANNRHQRKMEHDRLHYEENQRKMLRFESFLADVGGILMSRGLSRSEDLVRAGSSLHQIYIYAPQEWRHDLKTLEQQLMKYKWDEAMELTQKLSCLISEELKNG